MNPDLYRAPRLVPACYSEPQLHQSLNDVFSGLPFGVSRAARLRLSDALLQMQRTTLPVGMEADLKLFAEREILCVKLTEKSEAELLAILTDVDRISRFTPAVRKNARKRTNRDAYRYYCRKVLSSAEGVHAFLSRNPNIRVLLDRILSNFVGNIRECLNRIRG